MNIVFQISGGIGKCIMATAVCKAIKTQYPDSVLIVISGYSDVFINNKNVDRVFNFGEISYFYDDFIKSGDFKIFAHDPYVQTEHVYQNEHLIKTWCEMFGITYNGELPELLLTDREKTFFSKKFSSDKPLLVLHTNGGGGTDIKYSWARDIPIITSMQVIEEFRDVYNIMHIRREDQFQLDHTISVTDSFRSLVGLLQFSRKRLLIDSFAQHAAVAIGKPSTVCWIANKPEVFGYDYHDNISANDFTEKPELRNAYLTKFNIGGNLVEFPFTSEKDIFDVDKIIKSIKNQ